MKINKKTLDNIFNELFPIFRSITGKGYRKSLNIISRYIKFKKLAYPSGKKIFDWVVPKEWVVKEAFIKVGEKKIVDIKNNNLHLVNYSYPVNKTMSLTELNKHLYSIPQRPNLIPFVTSYYKKSFGFCIQHNKRKKLKDVDYQVVINTNFVNGKIVNGVAKIKGSSKKTILLSTYLCHPSMANNELSGPLTMIGLYERISKWKKRQFNYLFLVNPETIGSICFLYKNKEYLKQNLDSGLVLTCLGGPKNKLSYKKSRVGNSRLDRLFTYLSKEKKVLLRDFDPTGGSDERQYCSSELNLPVGQVARTVYNTTYHYHTSGDDKKFMNISKVMKSIDEIENILKINDQLRPIKRYMPYCELQLGRKNLYPNINSNLNRNYSSDNFVDNRKKLNILLSLLSYADGENTILDIAHKSGFELSEIKDSLKFSIKNNLIRPIK